jgi:hypothetical protein
MQNFLLLLLLAYSSYVTSINDLKLGRCQWRNLYRDEPCRQRRVASIHDVATVLGQGLGASSDDDLLEFCGSEGRALVTLDLDFSNVC